MAKPKEWWEDFFHGIFLDLWTQAVPPEQTRQEADFLEKMLGAAAGARLLDVPCGNGRLSLELTARGYCLTGVDMASEYIEPAKGHAADKNVAIDFQLRDMRDLPWHEEFDGAFCFGNSFGYFDDQGNEELLRRIANVLKPGARFVLDVPTVAEVVLPKFDARTWYQVGDMYFLAVRSYDPTQGRLRSDYTLIKNGIIDQRSASYRVYTFREICKLCELAGFGELVALGGLEETPFTFGSPRLLLIGRKMKGA